VGETQKKRQTDQLPKNPGKDRYWEKRSGQWVEFCRTEYVGTHQEISRSCWGIGDVRAREGGETKRFGGRGKQSD